MNAIVDTLGKALNGIDTPLVFVLAYIITSVVIYAAFTRYQHRRTQPALPSRETAIFALTFGASAWLLHFTLTAKAAWPNLSADHSGLMLSAMLFAVLGSGLALLCTQYLKKTWLSHLAVSIFISFGLVLTHLVTSEALLKHAVHDHNQLNALIIVAIALLSFIAFTLHSKDSKNANRFKHIFTSLTLSACVMLSHHLSQQSFHIETAPIPPTSSSQLEHYYIDLYLIGAICFILFALSSISIFIKYFKARLNLSKKITLLAFSLITVTLTATSAVTYLVVGDLLTQQEHNKIINASHELAISIGDSLETLKQDLNYLAKSPYLLDFIADTKKGSSNPTKGHELLESETLRFLKEKERYTNIQAFAKLERKYIPTFSLGRSEHRLSMPIKASDSITIQDIRRIKSPDKDNIIITASTPIYDKKSAIAGTLMITMDVTQAFNVQPSLQIDEQWINDIFFFLIKDRTKIISASTSNTQSQKGIFSTLKTQLRSFSEKQSLEELKSITIEEQPYAIHFYRIALHDHDYPLTLVSLHSKQEIHEKISAILFELIAITLLLGLLAAKIGHYFSRRISHPILELTQATQRMSQFDFNIQIETSGKDEISTLNKAFMDLAKDLQENLRSKERLTQELYKKARHLEYQTLALNEHAIVSMTDARGVVFYVNQKFEYISQYNSDEIIGQTHHLINSNFHTKSFWQNMWQTISRGNVWHNTIKNKRKDGIYYWVETTVVPFLDETNTPYQYISVRTDVTTQKVTQERLIEAKHKLEDRVRHRTADLEKAKIKLETERDTLKSLVEGASSHSDPFYTLTKYLCQGLKTDGGLIASLRDQSKQIETLAIWFDGQEKENKIIDLDDSACIKLSEDAFYHTSTLQPDDAVFDMFSGLCKHYIGINFTDSNGRTLGVIAVVAKYDISDLDRCKSVLSILGAKAASEIERISAEREKLKAFEQKERFFANISHEIKTPIHSILSFSNFGLEKAHSASREKLEHYFKRIAESGDRLLLLINDLLDITKLKSGKMQYNLSTTDLLQLCERTITEFEGLCAERRLNLTLSRPQSLPDVECDAERVGQVIRNLISNAIKFSSQDDSIVLGLRYQSAANDDITPKVIISVEDHGIGIPPDELKDIFSAYVQSTSNNAHGTGLGLAISKEIILYHHGEIWAENNSQGGATVYFSLPVIEQQKAHLPQLELETHDAE